MVRYHIIVDGRVQSVGFRYFVQYTASTLHITGTVRNMDNSGVEIYAQGQEDILSTFLGLIKKGNGFSRIDDYSIKSSPLVEDERKFKIIYWL